MEIGALILGIIGFILAWIPGCGIFLGGLVALVGAILAIIALVKKMPKKKQAIAGLVLSILAFIAMIISTLLLPLLGIYYSNKKITDNVIKESNVSTMSEKAIRQYNEPFEAYQGNQTGSEARSLCNMIINHNSANSTDLTRQIEVVNGTASNKSASSFTRSQEASAKMVRSTIKSTAKYTVTMGYDSKTGRITQIGIKQNNESNDIKIDNV